MDEPFYYLSAEDVVPRDAVFVIIGGSVTVVPPRIFEGHRNLERVELQEGVEEIGMEAFRDCPNLERVDCPSSLRRIGMGAFSGCRRLSEVVLREGLRRIEAYAFRKCGLERIAVPSSVMEIGGRAFAYCGSLETATLAGGMVLVPREAFFRCSRLEWITISSVAIVVRAGEDRNGRTAEVIGGIGRDPANESPQLILAAPESARLILTSRYLALMSQEDRTILTDSIDQITHDQMRGAGPLNLRDAGVAHRIRACFANCLAAYKAGVAAVLELALWKTNMNQRREASPGYAAGEGETAMVDAPTRDDCRRTCGADIVVGPVLSYLWGPHRRAGQEENGGPIQP